MLVLTYISTLRARSSPPRCLVYVSSIKNKIKKKVGGSAFLYTLSVLTFLPPQTTTFSPPPTQIKECVDEYANIFLFSVQNMRNTKLKDVRSKWRESRFFFGRNKVMIHAFGRSAEEEYKDGIHELSDVSCVARTHASVHLFHPSVHFSRLDCTRGAASK